MARFNGCRGVEFVAEFLLELQGEMNSGATAVAADLIRTLAALVSDCFTGESQLLKDVSPDNKEFSSKEIDAFFTDFLNSISYLRGGIGGGTPDLISQQNQQETTRLKGIQLLQNK